MVLNIELILKMAPRNIDPLIQSIIYFAQIYSVKCEACDKYFATGAFFFLNFVSNFTRTHVMISECFTK